MNEEQRLRELLDYKILDTPPEEDLNEIAEIASAVCNVPMSLVTFIDSERQWYKAKFGVQANEVKRSESFCQFMLDTPYDIMVVDDPQRDARFKDNRHVTGGPQIRFYAGAPLTSPSGHVMGTLCVFDSEHHALNDIQKHALKLLAKRVMEYINMRKIMIEQGDMIEYSASKLKKLTDLVPGVIFQAESDTSTETRFSFMSKGVVQLHPRLTPAALSSEPDLFFRYVHDDDRARVKENIRMALVHETVWNDEFRLAGVDGKFRWYWGNGRTERTKDAKLIMYGVIHDIESRKQYEQVLDQILHDVSHVMRRPVTSMLGLVALMEQDSLDPTQLKEYMRHVKTVFSELEVFTRKLNERYNERKDERNRDLRIQRKQA